MVAAVFGCTALYGRALERFDDRDALADAMIDGALLPTDEAAAYLRIRTADFAHLVRAGWIEAYDRVRSRRQSRRSAGWGRAVSPRRPRRARRAPRPRLERRARHPERSPLTSAGSSCSTSHRRARSQLPICSEPAYSSR